VSIISTATARILAGLELNTMVASGVLPSGSYNGVNIAPQGTMMYDITGERLFIRFPLMKNRVHFGVVDVACNTSFPAIILSVTHFKTWQESHIKQLATVAVRQHIRRLRFDSIRFIALGRNRTAAQFIRNRQSVGLIELGSWVSIEPAKPDSWSFKRQFSDGTEPLQAVIDSWGGRYPLDPVVAASETYQPTKIQTDRFMEWYNTIIPTGSPRPDRLIQFFGHHDIRYRRDLNQIHRWRPRDIKGRTKGWCFEMRTRYYRNWCVIASTQMLLDFYRYVWTQKDVFGVAVHLWQEMNGDEINIEDPNITWPESNFNTLPSVIKTLSNNGILATLYSYSPYYMPINLEDNVVGMQASPISPWVLLLKEIRLNHPPMILTWGACTPTELNSADLCKNEGKAFDQTHATIPVATRAYLSFGNDNNEEQPWRYVWLFDPAEYDAITSEDEEPPEYQNVDLVSYDLLEALDICFVCTTRTS